MQDKPKVEISQNFVTFSEYMNFNYVATLNSLISFAYAREEGD